LEATAYNRAYLALVNAFAQILLRRTSDTLGTLTEIRSAISNGRLREA